MSVFPLCWSPYQLNPKLRSFYYMNSDSLRHRANQILSCLSNNKSLWSTPQNWIKCLGELSWVEWQQGRRTQVDLYPNILTLGKHKSIQVHFKGRINWLTGNQWKFTMPFKCFDKAKLVSQTPTSIFAFPHFASIPQPKVEVEVDKLVTTMIHVKHNTEILSMIKLNSSMNQQFPQLWIFAYAFPVPR